MATQLTDEELGLITIHRSARARTIRVRIAPNGTLRASLPLYAPIFLLKRLIKSRRAELREMIQHHNHDIQFAPGMQIGKSHTLIVRASNADTVSVARHGQQIIVSLPANRQLHDSAVVHDIRAAAQSALRIEARQYLPRRLSRLAQQHGFSYQKVRFSHAGSRWGSCSSSGTISLNIALMKLPFELIDYVLIHELSHTREMNHSPAFWALVEAGDPLYKEHRRQLKKQTPTI